MRTTIPTRASVRHNEQPKSDEKASLGDGRREKLLGALARAAEVVGVSSQELFAQAQAGRAGSRNANLRPEDGYRPPVEGQTDPRARKVRRAAARATRRIARGSTRHVNSVLRDRKAGRAEDRERAQKRKDAAARRDAARAARQVEWVAKNEHKGGALKFIPFELWCLARAICSDISGATARHWLRMCTNKIFAGQIRKVALVPLRDGGYHYDWYDQRARDVVAVGALLIGMAEPIRRRRDRAVNDWDSAENRWGTIVRGVCRNLILAALAPNDKHLRSTSYLTGTYGYGGEWNRTPLDRGGRVGVGCGIIVALEQLGALYRNQWAGQGYATSSGYQPNQYWITSCVAEYGYDNKDTALRATTIVDEIAAELADNRHYMPGPFDRYDAGGPEPPAQP